MIDLVLLKEDLYQCHQDLDIHVQVLEKYIHEESFLKVNTFCRQKGEEIQYNYNLKLKPLFTFLKNSLKVLFSLCLRFKSPESKTVDISILENEIKKSRFITCRQKRYLISITNEGESEIKRHNRYCREFIPLTQKIETKIDTIKLLNCFINEKYVINRDIQTEPVTESYELINDLFDEYYYWEKPLEGISELSDLNYNYTPNSKKSPNSDNEIWCELIKTTYAEKCDPFLNFYSQIKGGVDQDVPDLKKRRLTYT